MKKNAYTFSIGEIKLTCSHLLDVQDIIWNLLTHPQTRIFQENYVTERRIEKQQIWPSIIDLLRWESQTN